MPLEIRPFQPADTETLRTILVDGFDGVSIDQNIERRLGPVGSRDWRWRKGRHLDDDIRRDPAGIFVAIVDGEIAGFVTTWMDKESSVGFIPNLAVHEKQRGQGVGRKLLEFALDYFRQHKLAVARIETLDQNAVGQHLYPSVGFTEVARQIHFAVRLD
jgi:ribosomal protein S18 acetylase RimI-like enzyme